MADVRLNLPTSTGDGKIKLTPTIDGTWVATLSNGKTITEKSGEWTIKSGEPLPWTRLCYFLADNDLLVTSLRYNFKGHTIHMPRAKLDKFGLTPRAPKSYSLAYKIEAEMDLNGGEVDQKAFVALTAHYDGFAVNFVQDLQDGKNNWVIVTDDMEGLAQTPVNK